MKQLTVRGFDPELEHRLLELARDRSISLNRAALLLMHRGAGLAPRSDQATSAGTVGSALDRFIGVWSEEDEQEFLRSLESVEGVDPELWK